MSKWNISMQDEKDRQELLTEGWKIATVIKVTLITEEESKSGHPYFVWDLKTEEGSIVMRTTLKKGVRWLLKHTLLACGIKSKSNDPEKKYSFSPEDVEGKDIMIKVTNKKNEFTGRDGDIVFNTKSEVAQVKKVLRDDTPVQGETNKNDPSKIPF